MDSFEIKPPPGQPDNLDALTAGQLLTDLFQPGSDDFNRLAYEIQREFRAGGSPQITSMVFDRVKFDKISGKGSFRVLLDINFTFGCEDVLTEKSGQTSEWTFEVDVKEGKIAFHSSPYADSRSTADEF